MINEISMGVKMVNIVNNARKNGMRVRGKCIGEICKWTYDRLEGGYDNFTQYIDDYKQMKAAENHNNAIRNEQRDILDLASTALADEDKRLSDMYLFKHPGSDASAEIAELKASFNTMITGYEPSMERLNIYMLYNAAFYHEIAKDESTHVFLKSIGCDIYDELNAVNGMFDLHEGIPKGSKLYRDNIDEQKAVLAQFDADVESVCMNEFGRNATLAKHVVAYIDLSNRIAANGINADVSQEQIDSIITDDFGGFNNSVHFTTKALLFMRDYDKRLFDAHFAETTVDKIDQTPNAFGKRYANGVWLHDDGTYENARFNINYGNHEFTKKECGQLFTSQEITISDFKPKAGKECSITGCLTRQEYNGKPYIGFERTDMNQNVKNNRKVIDVECETILENCDCCIIP